MKKVLVTCMLMVLFACASSDAIPENILQPGKMKTILYDLARADEFVNIYVMRDTTLSKKQQHIKMYEQIFTIHKTNHDEFFKSFKYYQEHPKENKALFDSLAGYFSKQRGTLYESKDTLNLHKDRR